MVVRFVPLLVPRPTPASKAGCPNPLVGACRTKPLGFESIPYGSAAIVEIFGMITVPASPAALSCRSPFAQRTPNAGDRFRDFRFLLCIDLRDFRFSIRAAKLEWEIEKDQEKLNAPSSRFSIHETE